MVESTNFDLIKQIKEYAKVNNVPIMQDEGIGFLTTFIIKNKIKKVLEIGTAIGYSAIMMATSDPNVLITSVEKDEERYLEALKNIKRLGLENRITLIFNDALELRLEDKYDLIFIDAAKSKNIEFFENFERNLNADGYIITDNLTFHGLVDKNDEDIKSKNVRNLVRKIREYIEYLKANNKYETIFYEIGDGVSISKRISE